MLALWDRVDLGAMAMKEYSAFPKGCFVSYQGNLLGESYRFAENQSAYSSSPTDSTLKEFRILLLVIGCSIFLFQPNHTPEKQLNNANPQM